MPLGAVGAKEAKLITTKTIFMIRDNNQIQDNTQSLQMAVMRSFFVRNRKPTLYTICVLGLIYVNTGFPFRVKRIDYGQTFYEVMY